MIRQTATILSVGNIKELLEKLWIKQRHQKIELVSLSGINANNATFFSPRDFRSSSSVDANEERLSRLNFSSLDASVICIDFNVFDEPER